MASSRRLVFRLTDRDPFMWSLVGPEVTGPGLAAIEYWLHEEASLSAIDVLVSPELEPQFMDFVDAVQVRYPDLAVKKIQKVTAGNSQEQLLLLIVGDGHIEEAMDWMSRVTSGQLDGALFVTERSHQPGQPFAFREIARTGKQRRGGYLVKEPAATYRAEAKPRIPTAKQMGILGDAPPLLTAVEVCQTMAVHDVPVLILGETGTGKELFARYVHACSARFDKPFVTVNCGALPDALVESLLFGHRKGAFTGATRDALGKFFEADGGTLFLDEIGELPLEQQPKLLRALQEKVVEPVGGSARAVDVRVIAATHRGLQQMVRAGSFREDLYYRLSYATIDLPALRERIDDIPELASAFVHEYNQSLREPKRLTPEAVARLQAHTWPGNVRELQNVLGRSLLLASEAAVGPASLMIQPPLMEQYDFALPAIDDDFEMEVFIRQLRGRLIDHALSITGSNQSAAARLLGISSQAINKFLRQKNEGS